MSRIQTYQEFWPFYLREHSSRTSRNLHFIGTASALSLLIPVLVFFPAYWPALLVLGYAFAWVGHFRFEKNRPATFKYPIWSLASDFKMLFHFLKGSLDAELKKAGVQEKD